MLLDDEALRLQQVFRISKLDLPGIFEPLRRIVLPLPLDGPGPRLRLLFDRGISMSERHVVFHKSRKIFLFWS